MIALIAPAKINLYLHITDKRMDGYHCLDSLFVFTELGDHITITPASTVSLTIDGPFQSSLLCDNLDNNLIYRAAKLLQKKYAVIAGAHIHLSKHIPIAAGLGGGSSDAATVLKGLNTLWNLGLDEATLATLGLSLGADVPACIYQQSIYVSGIGEVITPASIAYPPTPILLIKPPESLSTQRVFQHYAQLQKPFSPLAQKPSSSLWSTFVEQLKQNHNDLEAVAIDLMPTMRTLLSDTQTQTGCMLARMSGSGSACFGIFNNEKQVQAAKDTLHRLHPTYWIEATKIIWS